MLIFTRFITTTDLSGTRFSPVYSSLIRPCRTFWAEGWTVTSPSRADCFRVKQLFPGTLFWKLLVPKY